MSSFLVSTLVMGALAALVLVAVVRSRRWHTYSADSDELAVHHGSDVGDGDDGVAPERPETETPLSWLVGFVALVALSVGGVFVFVTNPDAPADLLGGPVIAIGGLLVVGYLLAGTYYAARGRGHPSSIAAAESATVFCILFLIAVSSQLIG